MNWRHQSKPKKRSIFRLLDDREKSDQKTFQIGNDSRVKLLALFFIIFSALIVARLFDLQILRGDVYAALAIGQHELYKKLFPERGSIYVIENNGTSQNLFPLVTNRDLTMLYAVPAKIENHQETAEKLFDVLGFPDTVDFKKAEKDLFADISPEMDVKLAEEIKKSRTEKWWADQKKAEIDKLVEIFSRKNLYYRPIRHKLTDEQVEKVKSLQITGLEFTKETWRYYPEKGMGGHIFGFVGFDDDKRQGKYGLEGYYDELLSGKAGEIHSERDVWGNIITMGNNSISEKVDGSDLVLTIDRAIQYKACQALYAAVEKFKAENGSIIVMDPKTGAIIAMCGAPDYNPDEYNKVEDVNIYNNPAIFNAYEPGSIFKSFTMAAALDAGKVQPNSTYIDTGKAVYGPHTIRNFNDKVYGEQTMTNVLENSINTGVIWAMQQTTAKVFSKYINDFGFGDYTGITLDKEMPGDISNLSKKGEIYSATASFGQGITATALQDVTAMAAVANEGKLMKPYIVSQIINHKGEQREIVNTYPQEVSKVTSSKSAKMLGGMLVSVVENGHGGPAKVPGYYVAGKTGTAQAPGKDGRYSSDVFTSFVGFAPFSDPKFAMIVNINRPQWGKEAVVIAAPVFGDVAKFILQYYNVPHDDNSK